MRVWNSCKCLWSLAVNPTTNLAPSRAGRAMITPGSNSHMTSIELTVTMQMAIGWLHWTQTSNVCGMGVSQCGQGVSCSSGSAARPLGGRRTVISTFFLYLASIRSRYSGRIRTAAYWWAAFFRPARSHSMTVDVRICTASSKGTHQSEC